MAAVPFSGFGQSTSTPFALVDKSAISTKTDGSAGSVGYARILPNSGQTTPSGVAIYGYTPANVLVGEAGVPASPLLKNGRIYAEVGAGGFAGAGTDIGLAIANPGTSGATISYTFTNSSGVDVGTGSAFLAAGAQTASYLDQPTSQNGFNVPLNFQGTFSFSSTVPISVVALQQFTNARGEGLFTTLPVLDLDPGAAPTSTTPAVLSQFADGANWTTEVLLVNPTNNTISGSIQFLVVPPGSPAGSAGAPISLTANGTTASSFSYQIASHSSFKLLTAGANPGATATGSVVVTPSSGSVTPFSLAVFSFASNNTIVTQAGVPSNLGTSFRTYVETSSTSLGPIGSYSTGYAVANTSSTSGTITLTLYNPDGSATPYSATVPIGANGQIAEFLYQRFPTLPLPFQGILRISTSTPQISVVALRIRVNERGEYLQTSIPPTEENGMPPSAEYDFPQIADGFGFTTQFILFSGYTGQATNGTLSFVRPNGQALSLKLNSTITGPPPTLTSISPTTAAVGSTITLTGTGFTSSSAVNFTLAAGTMAVTPSSQTSTQLTAVVPSNAVSGPVFVSNGSQSSASIVLQVTSGGGTGNTVGTPLTVSSGQTTTGGDIFVAAPAGSLSFFAVGTASSGAAYEQPVMLTRGSSTQVFIVGNNFSSSTVISASGSGDITIAGLTVLASTQLEFTINVSPSAATGPRTLIATNPNGDISTLTGGMIIQ